jgi:hypothetical protein
MLRIRSEQVTAMRDGFLREFEFRAAGMIRATRPEFCDGLKSEELEGMVQIGGETARSYGLRTEEGQLHFLMLMLEYGPGFDTRLEWVSEVLLDADLEPQSKIDELLYRAGKHGSRTVRLDRPGRK